MWGTHHTQRDPPEGASPAQGGIQILGAALVPTIRSCDHAAQVPAVRAEQWHLPQIPFIDCVLDIPVMPQTQVRTVPNCAENGTVQFLGEVVDVPVVVPVGGNPVDCKPFIFHRCSSVVVLTSLRSCSDVPDEPSMTHSGESSRAGEWRGRQESRLLGDPAHALF